MFIAIHQAVFLQEILTWLNVQPDSFVIDCTTGEGGHSLAFAQRNPQGTLLCLDRDAEILEKAKERLHAFPQARFVCVPFDEIEQACHAQGLGKAHGILADLGVSTYHFKEAHRGFSFEDTDSLDMRLSNTLPFSAKDLLHRLDANNLAQILWDYGEERDARRIAQIITRARPITSSKQLADLIRRAKPYYRGKTHPATQTFQALRIAVNHELELLERFVPRAFEQLQVGGVFMVISFHSLEDRMVKRAFRLLVVEQRGQLLFKKPLIPSPEERQSNPSARSAKLRAIQRLC